MSTPFSEISSIVNSLQNDELWKKGSCNINPLSESCSPEKLEGEKLNVAEVTQSEIAQKQKLQTVLERINDSLKLSARSIRWTVDCKSSSTLSLLLHLVEKAAVCKHIHGGVQERPLTSWQNEANLHLGITEMEVNSVQSVCRPLEIVKFKLFERFECVP